MQDVVAPGDCPSRELQVGDVALEKLHGLERVQIAALAGNEGVGHADAMAAPHEFFREVRSDESGAAGHEVVRHAANLSNIYAFQTRTVLP